MDSKQGNSLQGSASLTQTCIFQESQQNGVSNLSLRLRFVPPNTNFDFAKLKQNVIELVRYHQILSTSFLVEENTLEQRVQGDVEKITNLLVCEQLDVRDATSCSTLLDELVKRPFDLSSDAPLIRMYLICSETTKTLCMILHPIAYDHSSGQILIRDLGNLYLGSGFVPPPLQFINVAERERTRGFDANQDFWKAVLQGTESLVMQLPFDRTATGRTSNRGRVTWQFPSDLFQKMQALKTKYQLTTFTFMLSCFHFLLHKICQQTDIVVGTMRPSRDLEFEGVIGPFLRAFIYRTHLDPFHTLGQFFSQVNTLDRKSVV